MENKNDNLNLTSDNELVEISKKDSDAFAVLVDRYWQSLFRFVRRISYFSHEDIEDILQEVFIKVYKNLNGFDNDLKFSTWIYQITRNSVIDAIRRKQARPKSIQMENDELISFFKDSFDLENVVAVKDNLEKVKEILETIPMDYREVMILKFLEEKSYEEIVDIVKKPKGTIASLINRGKKILKNKFEEQGLILYK